MEEKIDQTPRGSIGFVLKAYPLVLFILIVFTILGVIFTLLSDHDQINYLFIPILLNGFFLIFFFTCLIALLKALLKLEDNSRYNLQLASIAQNLFQGSAKEPQHSSSIEQRPPPPPSRNPATSKLIIAKNGAELGELSIEEIRREIILGKLSAQADYFFDETRWQWSILLSHPLLASYYTLPPQAEEDSTVSERFKPLE